jgi:hypothetical protein
VARIQEGGKGYNGGQRETPEPDAETSSRTIPTPPPNLSEYMRAIGRKGGLIGGERRLKTMTEEERHNIAAKAARARWKKR